MSDELDADKAFRQVGRKCFTRCNAKVIYVVVPLHYGYKSYGSCGDHLTNAIRECASQYSPPAESVEVFWRPLCILP